MDRFSSCLHQTSLGSSPVSISFIFIVFTYCCIHIVQSCHNCHFQCLLTHLPTAECFVQTSPNTNPTPASNMAFQNYPHFPRRVSPSSQYLPCLLCSPCYACQRLPALGDLFSLSRALLPLWQPQTHRAIYIKIKPIKFKNLPLSYNYHISPDPQHARVHSASGLSQCTLRTVLSSQTFLMDSAVPGCKHHKGLSVKMSVQQFQPQHWLLVKK